ncbi:hypothetical protein CDAR_375121 [Caerostris darwini]|uniref:Uncharacterized protein n=1 Tax=Caerostris darwini TaxID=1538125 RepID=A0AAV4RLT6_9ARAC|nr:hypothetical protein CDAR_375121 [Caerostris darwini]
MGRLKLFREIRNCVFGFALRGRRRKIRRIDQCGAIPTDPSDALLRIFRKNSSFSAIQFRILSDLLPSKSTDSWDVVRILLLILTDLQYM